MQRLDTNWLLATDPTNSGRNQRWFAQIQAEAQPAPVPGIIQQVFPNYHGVAWYWLTFRTERTLAAGERALIHFGAVDYAAEVWLNGQPVGSHANGETPFTLDVTAALRDNDENLLAVRVLNPTDEPIEGIVLQEVPHRNRSIKRYQPGSMFNMGGICMPVDLEFAPALRIEDLYVRPNPFNGEALVQVQVRNDTSSAIAGELRATIGPALTAEHLDSATLAGEFGSGVTTHTLRLQVGVPRLWDLHDPYLYRVEATVSGAAGNGLNFSYSKATRCGFRDFRVVNGFFRLNGRRIFVKSSHSGNHFPVGQSVPQNPDLLRRDLLNAKASGFNMVRFIAGTPWPEQLDFCDEIGLLVYDESLASWLLADSPHLTERYQTAMRKMVLRDRNHPSVAIWGMLNETFDGATFRTAVASLGLMRELDPDRLILLSSGRWDAQPAIGSVCNPGSTSWEHVWGIEAPDAPPVSNKWEMHNGGYVDRAGDAHLYPTVPQPASTNTFIRTLGQGTKPVFLSEYGIGSLFNAVREYRLFEQYGERLDLPDAALMAGMVEQLNADFERYGLGDVFAFPEDLLRESQRLHARQRELGFDLIRSNPQICGYNLTGLLDHAVCGEGLWTFWREWKPGIVDVLADGWAPLRWCVFADPQHGYVGQPRRIEIVLANEDVLAPGTYPVRAKIMGPQGVAWERRTTVTIDEEREGYEPPLAIPVLDEQVTLDGPAGTYTLSVTMERGGAPTSGRLTLYNSEAPKPTRALPTVLLLGVGEGVATWLRERGVDSEPFTTAHADGEHLVLVGAQANQQPLEVWQALARSVARGGVALLLAAHTLQRDDQPLGWLPLANKGHLFTARDWLYHKEVVLKRHPIFAGLPCGALMDWEYYDQVFPAVHIDGLDACDDVAAVAISTGYPILGGYASGLIAGSYALGAGRVLLSTFRVLEQLGINPAADQLLLNMISVAAQYEAASERPSAEQIEELLTTIGYR